MTTTLTLQPRGLAAISFGRDAAQAIDGYYVPTDTLELNEEDRIDFLYSETKHGGRAVDKVARLVDLTFTVFVIGADKNTTLSKAHNVNKAIMTGGILLLQVHGASLGSYYTYEPSPPAALVEMDRNKWDWEYPFHQGQFVVALEVTLKTRPYATSGSYVNVTPSLTALQNVTDGSGFNYFDLPAIKGDVPALFRLRIYPTASTMSRLYLCTRSSVLSDLNEVNQVLQAESATAINGSWGNTSNAAYSGGSAKSLSIPDDSYYGLKFSLSDEIEHRGLIGVMVAGTFASQATFQLGYGINGTEVWRDNREFQAESINTMHLAYAGEFHFPPMAVVDSLANAEINVYVKLETPGTALIDHIFLIFSDETVAQYDFGLARSVSIDSSQRFSIQTSNDNDRVAQITNSSGVIQYYARNVIGSLFLEARETTRVYVMWERANGIYAAHDTATIAVDLLYRTIYPLGN